MKVIDGFKYPSFMALSNCANTLEIVSKTNSFCPFDYKFYLNF